MKTSKIYVLLSATALALSTVTVLACYTVASSTIDNCNPGNQYNGSSGHGDREPCTLQTYKAGVGCQGGGYGNQECEGIQGPVPPGGGVQGTQYSGTCGYGKSNGPLHCVPSGSGTSITSGTLGYYTGTCPTTPPHS